MFRNFSRFPLIILLSLIMSGQPDSFNLLYEGEIHFTNMKQLTFGGENAEAYFSADGKRVIYQAHDEEGECDQIYIMELETGKIDIVSTGMGVTTCSFFQYPNDSTIIYSSTHLGSSECPERPDQSMGYVWPLFPTYDIFRANPDGSSHQQLTSEWGYDAEATYAFDGSRIIFTSLASGDLELWTMNPDGRDKQQLTERLGYDGGAFFSHDGSKIVWRAYYPETQEQQLNYIDLLKQSEIRPMALQIWVMDSNGSNKHQITNNNASNFAPFFYPDDKRIIFSSNLLNPRGRNFDLYAVDVEGGELEQITFYDGFDSFPMFSPDGMKLVFSSNRNQSKEGETNLFICDWVDK